MEDAGGGAETVVALGCGEESGGTAGTGAGGSGSASGRGGGGTGAPEPPPPADTCHTGDVVLDAPAVDRGFEQLWNASNASDILTRRMEQFGWLVRTETGYKVVANGVSGNFCGITESAFPLPPEGAEAVVGFVHTHPYTPGETILGCDEQGAFSVVTYESRPSPSDRNASVQFAQMLGRAQPLPGIILDAGKIVWFQGTDPAIGGTLSRCGY